MSELKPCPFCGSTVYLLDVAMQPSVTEELWDVYCANHQCYLSGGTNNMYETRHLAIEAWNTRVEPSELATLREQVKVLREALGSAKVFIKNGFDFGYITPPDPGDPACDILNNICKVLEQTKPKNEDPEKLAKLIASRVNGFGLSSAHKLVFRLRALDNIINAEPADLDAIFGKGSIKSIHLRKYLDDPVAVERLRERLQTKPKDGE